MDGRTDRQTDATKQIQYSPPHILWWGYNYIPVFDIEGNALSLCRIGLETVKYGHSWCRILYVAYESLIKDAPKLIFVVQFVNEFPNWPQKWPQLLTNALTIAIVKYLVVRNYNLLGDNLNIWAKSKRRPYADARGTCTDDLLVFKPTCPVCPLRALTVASYDNIATLEFRA